MDRRNDLMYSMVQDEMHCTPLEEISWRADISGSYRGVGKPPMTTIYFTILVFSGVYFFKNQLIKKLCDIKIDMNQLTKSCWVNLCCK